MNRLAPVPLALVVVAAAGCGAGKPKPPTAAPQTPPTTSTRVTTSGSPALGALQAESTATAAGDIPDNQVFLVFRNDSSRYSIKFPEGWAQRGAGSTVTFRDKNNIVRIAIARGGMPTTSSVRKDVAALHVDHAPRTITVAGSRALKVTYSTVSPPNPVTGKRVTLVVDRYYLSHAGRRAIVDLGTPVGVDNVDAYRLMIESFRWR